MRSQRTQTNSKHLGSNPAAGSAVIPRRTHSIGRAAKRAARASRNPSQLRAHSSGARVIVPDTSIIIEGIVSKKISSGELRPGTVIIPEAVLSELEHQANQGKETGYLGIEEIKRLRQLSSQRKFTLSYQGKRPSESEIKRAKAGEIDSLIREIALQENATLITADKVQALVAEAKGIIVILYEFEQARKITKIEAMLSKNVMSAHLRENSVPLLKKGFPGRAQYVPFGSKQLSHDELEDIGKEIVEEANLREDSAVESQRRGSTTIRLGECRIVISRPPFSDAYEIIAVRPVKRLSFSDYRMSDKTFKSIIAAQGMLITGAPGEGKTAFAQALAENLLKQRRTVRIIESQKGFICNIPHYSLNQGSPEELKELLLMDAPDCVFFDEMRAAADFQLFADLRFAGIRVFGTVHAEKPVEAMQRAVKSLGMDSGIIDTLIAISEGRVSKAFSISVEAGDQKHKSSARPVMRMADIETGKPEFEIRSYGEGVFATR